MTKLIRTPITRRFAPQAFTDPRPPQFYDCGICGHYHPVNWDGDCRDDANRFNPDQLDARFGENGWEEVDEAELNGV